VGLHYHLHQADYWYVPFGHARWCCTTSAGLAHRRRHALLDLGEVDGGENNHLGIYIPPGVAHGFAASPT
jgi:dTDP-4-dehydrorhamnose 3,5-epimerase